MDLKNIAKDAAFTAFTQGIKIGDASFGGATNWVKDGLNVPSIYDPITGARTTGYFSSAWVQNATFDAATSGVIQTGVYGGSLGDNFVSNFGNSFINEGLALTQNNIGDIKSGEGSWDGAILKGLAGCGAAKLGGTDCAAGAAAGIAEEFYSGQIDGKGLTDAQEQRGAYNWGLVAGTIFSGGDVGDLYAGGNIAASGIMNNRQLHEDDVPDLIEALTKDNPTLREALEKMSTEDIDAVIYNRDLFAALTPEQQRVVAASCALIRCDLQIVPDEYNDAATFRAELAKLGGSEAYKADRDALLMARRNQAAYTYNVSGIYADIETSTGQSVTDDAALIAGVNFVADVTDPILSFFGRIKLVRAAENGDPLAQAALERQNAELEKITELLSNEQGMKQVLQNAESSLGAALSEYNSAKKLLETAASGEYVDPEELRRAAFNVEMYQAGGVANGIITATGAGLVGGAAKVVGKTGKADLTRDFGPMRRPVDDPNLNAILDSNYGVEHINGARVGNGGTADVLRYEDATGDLLSRSGHRQKAIELRERLKTYVRRATNSPNPNNAGITFTKRDIEYVNELIVDLDDAIGEK